MMNSQKNGSLKRAGKPNNTQEGPNWVIVVGGVLLSTLSVKIGCKLRQVFDAKRQHDAIKAKRRPGARQMHSNLYHTMRDQKDCYYCMSGNGLDIGVPSDNPAPKEPEPSLPLVKIDAGNSGNENGVMWTSSPDRLEPPRKTLLYSHSSGSPSFSESGSDVYGKREVIQRLRQQLRRRDDTIMEMQAQIADLTASIGFHSAQSVSLQSHLDTASRDLFDAEREIRRLRKAIVDHCIAESGPSNKPCDAMNGHADGFSDGGDDSGGVKGGSRVGMLRRQAEELKEVIEGKELLLKSYKEQKLELSSRLEELQEKLAAQIPTIL